jgi:Xaa-Pro dipeptidase
MCPTLARSVQTDVRWAGPEPIATLDELVHGFGGGYPPAVIGWPGQSLVRVPDFEIEAGTTVVVQPKVLTADVSVGLQTGGLLHVTADGANRLHTFARGLGRLA